MSYNSVLVTVEVQVEVFFTYGEDGYESTSAICAEEVPRHVSKWAEERASDLFEKDPCRALKYG